METSGLTTEDVRQGLTADTFTWALTATEPRDPMSRSNLGIYLQKHGQMREAAAQYEAPVELTSDPGLLAQTYANRGAAHRALGDDKKSY